ncbi:MAG: hypothetical protein AAFY36_03400 [Bacteroidota bacterium]
MKTLFFCCLTLLSGQILLAQEEREELLNQLSQETCDCMGERDLTPENMEMVIGMCLLQAGGDKSDQIESLLGIQMMDPAGMYSLGEQVGMLMVMSCETFQNLMMDAAETGDLENYLENQGIYPLEIPDSDPVLDGDEEWLDIDRPESEEPFGGGDEDEIFFEDVEAELLEEVFPPTEEEWMDIDRPADEEAFGGGEDEVIDIEEEYIEEVSPPTEEEWVDIDRPNDEESFGDGSSEGVDFEDGEVAERQFITGPMPNTNRTAITYPTISGQIKRINSGIVNEIIVRKSDREEFTLYLTNGVPGAELLQRRADVTISYRETEIYDASRGANRAVLEIVSVE